MSYIIHYSLECDRCGRKSVQTALTKDKLLSSCSQRKWTILPNKHFCPSCKKEADEYNKRKSS